MSIIANELKIKIEMNDDKAIEEVTCHNYPFYQHAAFHLSHCRLMKAYHFLKFHNSKQNQ